MITPKNILQHELIGLDAKIEKSTDETFVDVKGTVIDETQNMLTIRSKSKEIKAAKKNCTFVFTLPGGTKVRVDGTLLHGDPIERLKKKQPKKWD